MKTEETIINGWVARDKESGDTSSLYLGQNKPRRIGEGSWGIWCDFGEFMALPIELFPEVTWESEPLEVEIVIRSKDRSHD